MRQNPRVSYALTLMHEIDVLNEEKLMVSKLSQYCVIVKDLGNLSRKLSIINTNVSGICDETKESRAKTKF